MSAVDRRTVIKAGALGATAFTLGTTGMAAAQSTIDLTPPAGWDYPAQNDLLPFGHGVASGDPLADRVILWTRITVPDARGWDVADPQGLTSIDVGWIIATDPALNNPVAQGTVTTTNATDWTVKVDAGGLASATTYYFAFTALGRRSPVGRTRTAPKPGDQVDELRFAHSACTSWWSTDLHFYKRIAERNDLDLFLHAGDHIYEFVDNSQWYRARNDIFDESYVDFREWENAKECGRRYALYYADPDVLAAHQSLPWCVITDNHDLDDHSVDGEVTFSRAQAAQVFWAWTPIRPPKPDGSGEFPVATSPNELVPVPSEAAAEFSYRVLPWGDLADVICIDIRTFRSEPSATAALGFEPPLGNPTTPAVDDILGPTQEAWLLKTLSESKQRNATFRVLLNSVNMSQVKASAPLQTQLASLGVEVGTTGSVYPNGWDQWPASRTRLFTFMRDNGIIDNIVMSGDAHGWFGSDLVEDNQVPNYEPATGGGVLGAVGVEVQPAGGGRVNLQGTVAREAYAAANGRTVRDDYENYITTYYPLAEGPAIAAEGVALAGNPNLRFLNWRTYGYGLVHITNDDAFLELWEVPMPEPTDQQRLMKQFRTVVGAPHLTEVGPLTLQGSRVSEPAPAPSSSPAPAVVPPNPAQPQPAAQLPATGWPAKTAVALSMAALGLVLRRRRDSI